MKRIQLSTQKNEFLKNKKFKVLRKTNKKKIILIIAKLNKYIKNPLCYNFERGKVLRREINGKEKYKAAGRHKL